MSIVVNGVGKLASRVVLCCVHALFAPGDPGARAGLHKLVVSPLATPILRPAGAARPPFTPRADCGAVVRALVEL